MAYVVNPPLRDDAIYQRSDQAAVDYRAAVPPRLPHGRAKHAAPQGGTTATVQVLHHRRSSHIESKADNPLLKQGMIKVLESLRTADQPIVSLRVKEQVDEKPSGKSGAEQRQKKLQELLVGGSAIAGGGGGIMDEFARISPPVQPPPGQVFTETPPPVGHQLIAFVEAPEEEPKPNAHFDVVYNLVPGSGPNRFVVEITINIRSDVEKNPEATSTLAVKGEFTLDQLDGEGMNVIRDRIVNALIGTTKTDG